MYPLSTLIVVEYAEYLGTMYDKGLAPQSGVTAVAAVKRAARESARAGHEIAEPPAGDLAAQRLEATRRWPT